MPRRTHADRDAAKVYNRNRRRLTQADPKGRRSPSFEAMARALVLEGKCSKSILDYGMKDANE